MAEGVAMVAAPVADEALGGRPNSVVELIAQLARLGVRLWLEADQLRFRAPQGVMTPELKSELVGRKAELIAFLREIESASRRPAEPPLERVPREGELPLSFHQERLWFLEQWDSEAAAYSIFEVLRLSGELVPARLAGAAAAVVERHEILRTTFPARGGKPRQQIMPPGSVPLPALDLTGLAEAASEAQALALATDEVRRPFDLSRGPLLRTLLVRMAPTRHLLVLNLHHVVSDGWSSALLVNELATVYRHLAGERTARLPDLPVQYADYAVWQRRWLQPEALDKQLEVWKRRLAGSPEVLDLPTDLPRPAKRSAAGGTHRFVLAAGTGDGVRALARELGTTPFVVLLGAYAALLSRLTDQLDVPVGFPLANRDRLELEPLIGFFVNTLVLRADLEGEPSFAALIGRLHAVVLEAQANRDVPFERLVEVLRPTRDAARSPLFEVMFVFQNGGSAKLELPGLSLERIELAGATAKFDLTLTVEDESPFSCELEYSTDLFTASTIAAWARAFSALLAAALADPDQPVSACALLSPGEVSEVLAAGQPRRSFPMPGASLFELFSRQVATRPDAVALVCEGDRLTYAELHHRAERLAHSLRRAGAGRGSRVAVAFERETAVVEAILGVLAAGAAYVPLDLAYPTDRLAFMIGDSGARWLVTRSELLPRLPTSPAVETLLLDREHEASVTAPKGAAVPPTDSGEAAYVIYTSGSTGRPKGVLVTHGNVLRLFAAAEETFSFGPEHTWTLFHSTAFDFSVWELWGALLYGGRLVVVPYWVSRSPQAFRDLLVAERVTVLNQTPSAFRQLVHADGEARVAGAVPGLALEEVIFGGEALDFASLTPWFSRHGDQRPRLVNMYGITETTVHVTFRTLTLSDLDGPGGSRIGEPLADLGTYVLDRRLQPLPTGVPGELCVAGAGLAQGYLGQPALTAKRFVPDPFSGTSGGRLYRSGDRGRRRSDGELEYLGRLDQQVKVRGFRIELGEIAACLEQHPAVRQVVVVARPLAGETALVAYFVPAIEPAPSPSQLRDHLRDRLPEHMVPAAFVAIPAMPLTTNGKVDRRALPAPAFEGGDEATLVAPRTALEEVLAGLWEDVLGRPVTGVFADFFDLGGHSLLATRLVARVGEALDLEVPLRALFEHRTVASLAAHLVELREAGTGAALPPIEVQPRDGGLPLSFAQERLWLFEQLNPGTPTYNTYRAGRVRGAFDLRAAETMVDDLVLRHEALRTRYGMSRQGPAQWIEPFVRTPLPVVDLRALAEGSREPLALALAEADARRPTDLGSGRLARAAVMRLAADDHVFVLIIHHVAYDLWSGGVILGEIEDLYLAAVGGVEAELPALPVQAADFAAWQRAVYQGERLAAELAYWRRQLAGLEAAGLALPADRPRPAFESQRGGSVYPEIPADLTEATRVLGRREGATQFMTTLALYDAFLARISGSDDLVVGSFVTNRNRVELESVVGYFDNTIVLRTDASGDPTFRELLARVKTVALEAYAHQSLPFETVVEAVQSHRGGSRTPLFQAAFIFELNYPAMERELGGLKVSPYNLHTATAKFDFALGWREAKDGLAGELEFNSDLFDATTIERFLGHQRILWQAAVAAPDLRLSQLPLLAAAEREQLTTEWGRGPAAGPRNRLTVVAAVAAQAARAPEAIAVDCGDETLSYGELVARARALADCLKGFGVGPEVPVALFAERSVAAVVGIFGVLAAGGAYVPLDPVYPQDRLAMMLEQSRAPVILVPRALAERLPATTARQVFLDDPASWRTGSPPAPATATATAIEPASLAYLIFTSGSTGRPKGVMIPHAALSNLVAAFARSFALGPGDRYLMVPSLAFDASVGDLFPALASGATLVLHPSPGDLSPAELTRFCQRQRITMMDIPMPHWSHWTEGLMAAGAHDGLPALSRLIVGGEAIHLERLTAWASVTGRRISVIGPYGPTEATVASTLYASIDGQERPPGTVKLPIGRPLDETTVFVVDRRFEPVPIGVAGEVTLGGAGLARGYLGRPAATAERFLPDPLSGEPGARLYRTGDLARFLADGELEFLGRADDQVKLRGFRIELGEIDNALAAHPEIVQALAVVREDRPGDRRLVAYLTSTATPPSSQELRRFLAERLPPHMVPGTFVPMQALPKLPNGKLDRRNLPAPGDTRPELEASYVAPRSELERQLAEIWARSLGLTRVGIDDNFFDLGGHSLLLVRLHGEIQRELGLELALVDFFERPSVRTLAQLLDERRSEGVVKGLRRDRDDELAAGKDRRRELLARRRQGRS